MAYKHRSKINYYTENVAGGWEARKPWGPVMLSALWGGWRKPKLFRLTPLSSEIPDSVREDSLRDSPLS